MTLQQDLLKPVREKGGSIASNRLDYQKDWSLCKLLEIHKSGSDYMFVFEHDEDLIILDSEEIPEKISFYQIKTKDTGNWKLKDLIKSGNGKNGTKLSFLGKLYSNKIKYGSKTESLNFVSNAKFEIDLKKNAKSLLMTKICLDNCEDGESKKILNHLKSQHPTENKIEQNLFFLHFSDLSLHGSSTHAIGQVTEFISNLSNVKHRPKLVYETIFNEIRRKSNYEGLCTTLGDLKKYKGLGKKEFSSMLETMDVSGEGEKFEEIWAIIRQRLNQEGEDVKIIAGIKSSWARYEVNILNYSDTTHAELCRVIKDLTILYIKKNKKIENLMIFLDTLTEQYKESQFSKSHQGVYNDDYIKAVILGKYHER